MKERAQVMEWIRSEIVGPSRPLGAPSCVSFSGKEFRDSERERRGPLAWKPNVGDEPQEILYYYESPYRKYGAGLLHPESDETEQEDGDALHRADTMGLDEGADTDAADGDEQSESEGRETEEDGAPGDDFEVTGGDLRRPSTMGISFCVSLAQHSELVFHLPRERRFEWQHAEMPAIPVNGRYERCRRIWSVGDEDRVSTVWRRVPTTNAETAVRISRSELTPGSVVRKEVQLIEGSPLSLRLDVFPRKLNETDWLVTAVLRNVTRAASRRGSTNNRAALPDAREATLYQAFFEVKVAGGELRKYPESQRPFETMDDDEKSLALLYRDACTWGIGHGCAAGWEGEQGRAPPSVFADVMPAVQLPSMTPDIEVNGKPVSLLMRDLASLSEDGTGAAWDTLDGLVGGYADWIAARREESSELTLNLQSVAEVHLKACEDCLQRMHEGLALLRSNDKARTAFRLANLAMLLQQIASKSLNRKELAWNAARHVVSPQGEFVSPWDVYMRGEEGSKIGRWRAFQIAFLLMSINAVSSDAADDRRIVDLIWFPTGGGKTEAYLALMAYYMVHERLRADSSEALRRDATNVIMRYTLRMLTTQQFQRAASLICALEFLRRNANGCGVDAVQGRRFSLGLWIGGAASPNSEPEAAARLAHFRSGGADGNPLILTECPWCRSAIGRCEVGKPRGMRDQEWKRLCIAGIANDAHGPALHCSSDECEFGKEDSGSWLPIEVIDTRIYRNPPSLVIATVDKLAMISFRPEAGALFGRDPANAGQRRSLPPGLIVQDELHLISGPLGTMYALYEGIFERLCTYSDGTREIGPKIIASTATVRGAAEQVRGLYARERVQLFPSPGLSMSDSFFGKYARDQEGRLRDGRLYLGVHAADYGSVLTTQVRAFSAALFRPASFEEDRRDPWWTLLAFYNSIRELGGARTLFDSDIRSRLKYIFNREGFGRERRNLRIVEELTGRLDQAQIVRMMDRLSRPYSSETKNDVLDSCLASNVIEVGVDIDRLSLMGIVGQPKATASYIQVSGRVGRRWEERPGLVLMIYNPSKTRDRSHFEQFHSYHRRLYERVEPASVTPFSVSALQRGFTGVLIAWARQHGAASVEKFDDYEPALSACREMLLQRSELVQSSDADRERTRREIDRIYKELRWKWSQNPQDWWEFPQSPTGEYLMLWPGQYASSLQKTRGTVVPSSMRQVDRSGELTITAGYAAADSNTDQQER